MSPCARRGTLPRPSRVVLLAGTLVALSVVATPAAGAQDEEGEPTVAYSTGIAGEVPRTVEPSQTLEPDGQLRIAGLQLIDIPVRFTDDRLTGRLTIWSNGTGRSFSDGFARLEPRSYRIDNERGAWAGTGERILAVSVRRSRPLINHESMVLLGEGAYDGLVAYVFIELAGPIPVLEAVILEIDVAATPEAIPPPRRRDIERRPSTDTIAGGTLERLAARASQGG